MLDPAVAGASVNWLDVELTDSSVRKHVREGLRVDRLAIHFDELLSCVIDQEGIIRKLKLLGLNNANEAADEASDDIDDVAPLARQDAAGLERVAQYIIRNPFSEQKMVYNAENGTVIYRSRMHAKT